MAAGGFDGLTPLFYNNTNNTHKMAGDWIKIELTTPDKPEVIAIAAHLRIDQDAVVGKLVRLWAWADLNSIDGDALCITEAFVDRLANRKGFALALRNAGWLQGYDGNLTFPDFSRHNGKSAKRRAEGNRRVASHRGKCNTQGVTNALQKALPEKRREDIREREREPASPDVSKSEDQPLRDLANSLRPGWQASPVFSPDEEAAFQINRSVLRGITPAAWEAMAGYLLSKHPEGAAEWQPRQRIMFLKRPGDLAAAAVSWAHKRPQAPKPKPLQVHTEEEAPPMTTEEIKAIFSQCNTDLGIRTA